MLGAFSAPRNGAPTQRVQGHTPSGQIGYGRGKACVHCAAHTCADADCNAFVFVWRGRLFALNGLRRPVPSRILLYTLVLAGPPNFRLEWTCLD